MAMKRKNLPEVVPELFEHEQFGQFRFIKRGEEIWFVAVDLCRALDIQNVRQNLADFPEDEKMSVVLTDSHSKNGVMNTVSSTYGSSDAKKGWIEKRLPDISLNKDSKRVPITKSQRESGSVPYYGASGIVDYVKDYIFDGEYLLVSEDGANLESRTYPIAFSITGSP